jgi:hypothetical protein
MQCETKEKTPFLHIETINCKKNSYLRYKCKKLSFIARTGLNFKRCECNKGTFYTYVLHFIYDLEIITPVST